MKKLNTRLYLVTDSTGMDEKEFLQKIESAISGGVTFLQLREKEKTTIEYINLARKVHQITKKHGIPLIIDDRVDVAMAVGCEGVHLGGDDMEISDARRILGKDYIIGATAKTVEKAQDVWKSGADYIGTGAIFPTTTKVKTVLTSTDTLDQVCRSVPIPVNAIGGLNRENIDVLKGIPISGVCVVSAIMKAKNPQKATEELREAMKEKLGL